MYLPLRIRKIIKRIMANHLNFIAYFNLGIYNNSSMYYICKVLRKMLTNNTPVICIKFYSIALVHYKNWVYSLFSASIYSSTRRRHL